MTFGEKLTGLRKREGLSQEALAEQLGVSRQAVSRWEQGAALPDAAKLLPCARLFSVDVEWLLDEEQDGEDRLSAAEFLQGTERPSVHRDWPWYIAGGIVTGAGSLGMVTMGILSAVFPVVVSEAPAGVEWVRIYTGLAGFLKAHGVEWLFALWAAVALAGLWLLAQPPIRRREQTASQFSSWYAAGVAVGLYGVGQTAWYVQLGKLRDLPVLALFLAAAVWCTVRQFWRLGGGAGRDPQAAGTDHCPAIHRRTGSPSPADGGGGLWPGGAGAPYWGVFHLRCSHNLEAVRQGKALNTKTGGRSPGLLPLCLFGYPIR